MLDRITFHPQPDHLPPTDYGRACLYPRHRSRGRRGERRTKPSCGRAIFRDRGAGG